MRRLHSLVFVVSGVAAAAVSVAQVPMTNYCGTARGICMINGYGPAGYPCNCMADPGQLVVPANMGTVCGTQYGMCPVLPLYRGTVCACGGAWGRVI
jgi:hypothetical protein